MSLARNVTATMEQEEIEQLAELFEILGIEDPGDIATGHTEMTDEAKQRFTITNLEQLNWAFRKIVALEAKNNEVEALANKEIERIKNWAEKEKRAASDTIKFFQFLISEYAENKRLNDPKYKGDKTPYGIVGFKKQQLDWTYGDEQKAAEFLEGFESLKGHVKTVKSIVNKTNVKKALEIKWNVFVNDGIVVDVANEVNGTWTGMQYMERVTEIDEEDGGGHLFEIIDMETGEVVKGVNLILGPVVVADSNKIVPEITVTDRPDKVEIKTDKPEA